MALSDLILSKGEIIVLESSGTSGMTTADAVGEAITFGTIQKVNGVSTWTVGQSVLFFKSKSTPFTMISQNVFWLVNESDIKVTEVTPP